MTAAGLPGQVIAIAVGTVLATLVLGAAVAGLLAWSSRRRDLD